MYSFRDNENREWICKVDIATLKRLRSIDIDVLSDKFTGINLMVNDMVKLAEGLVEICHNQIAERKMSTDDFLSALSGDAIEHASIAMIDAVIDFFPKSRREILKKAFQKSRDIAEKELEKQLKKANKLIDEMDSESVMKSPELSE